MGVKGLWRLLLPIGRRISVESLEGRTLAIDASIWITQFLKAMRDKESGKVQNAAHLIGFFRRICRLLFHGIRPIFVFDGATPEIKRREVLQRRRRREKFSTLGDTELQRLAKRLLRDNLKKSKLMSVRTGMTTTAGNKSGKEKGDGGGSFAVGFHLAGGDEPNDDEKNINEQEVALCSSAASQGAIVVNQITNDSAAPAELGDINQESTNDWDMEVQQSNENSGSAAKEGHSDVDDRDYTEGDVETKEDDMDSDFDITYILSLPAAKRKEAIEDAKRQQRLRSRKEFMPAAARPDAFSQVQLTNFLRSSRLNQSIVKMAVKAVEKDSHGIAGEVMASDRTTRVMLDRSDDDENYSDTDEWLSRSRKKRKIRKTKNIKKATASRKKAGFNVVCGGVDLSEEEDWEEPSSVANRCNIFAEDDDDDGIDNCGGNGEADIDSARKSAPIFVLDALSDADDETDNKRIKPIPQCIIPVDDDDSEPEGGGFLKERPQPDDAQRKGKKRLASKPAVGKRERAETDHLTDGELAQEFDDHALATALQEVEYFDAPGATDVQKSILSVDANAPSMKIDSNTNLFEPSSFNATNAGGTSKSFDVNKGRGSSVNILAKQSALSRETTDPVSTESTCSSEGDVDWEDGEDCDNEDIGQERAGTEKAMGLEHSNVGKHEKMTDDIMKIKQNREGIPHMQVTARKDTPDILSDHASIESISVETAKALKQAETTASNLTNWAGRAMRRAIKEANESNGVETPKAVIEHAYSYKLNNLTKCKDGSSHDVVSVVKQAQDRDTDQKQDNATAKLIDQGSGTDDNAYRFSGGTQDDGSLKTTLEKPSVGLSRILNEYSDEWSAKGGQKERELDTMTDEMKEEIICLLQLFGVPYVDAPAEAEAQCVTLEELGLVDGIVTEDSDVFCFGGKTVYKNIFEEQKYVEVYLAKDAEKEMALGRNHMVALAMILGGDYSEGVKGVGIVNAMEVFKAFDVSDDLKGGLEKFRKWLDGFELLDVLAKNRSEAEEIFLAKHKAARGRWAAPENFPAENVMQAYLNPVVDKSKERFSWGSPDVDNLLLFCEHHIGWRPEDTRRLLEPVVARIGSGYRQTRIDSFMTYEHGIKFADVRSKRLRAVLGLEKSNDNPNNKQDFRGPKANCTSKSARVVIPPKDLQHQATSRSDPLLGEQQCGPSSQPRKIARPTTRSLSAMTAAIRQTSAVQKRSSTTLVPLQTAKKMSKTQEKPPPYKRHSSTASKYAGTITNDVTITKCDEAQPCENLWKERNPADLGAMAADVEFRLKKRPHT